MLQRLQGLVSYTRVFPSVRDIRAFRHIAYRDGQEPVDVHVREAGVSPLRIRPHTSDAAVLWDTFHEKFHLPPCPLRPCATILDLGANVGYTAMHFAHLYPTATIIAVELDRANFEAARRNLRTVSGCRLLNAAVWSEDGIVAYDSSDPEWAFHVSAGDPGPRGAFAPAKTVSTLIAEHDLSWIDYVKMDIEGAEWPVLSADAEWLGIVGAMKVELHPKFNADATFENCARVLRARGFACRKDDRHWNTLVALRS
jgi:FkbM family methyltransferase